MKSYFEDVALKHLLDSECPVGKGQLQVMHATVCQGLDKRLDPHNEEVQCASVFPALATCDGFSYYEFKFLWLYVRKLEKRMGSDERQVGRTANE